MKKNNKKQTIAALAILIVAAFLLLFRSCNKKVDTNETVIEPTINEVVEVPNNTTQEEVVIEEVTTTEVKEEVKDNTTLSYWVNFLNKDGSVLQRTVYKYGETPSYKGTTPTYNDYAYYYSFKGWDKQTSPVKGTQTYTALYDIVGEVASSKSSSTLVVPEEDHYLTFTANVAGSTIALKKNGSPANINLQYSTDNGSTWNDYAIASAITLTSAGDSVKFKGSNTSFSSSSGIYYYFEMTGNISASGDVTSLLNEIGGDISLSDFCFSCLFSGCESLTSAPSLPSTTLSTGCYFSMFGSCKSLTSAPKLPATVLNTGCYYYMFAECISLTSAPKLPATVLAPHCYHGMFNKCTQLRIDKTDATGIDDKYIIFTIPSDFSNYYGEVTDMFSLCNSNGFQGTPSAIGAPQVDTIYYWYTSD